MKCTLTDSGIGVMLILRGPTGGASGQVSDALVSHIDLFPTICDLLEISPPAWLQGTSLLPLIRGEATQVNQEIHAEVSYHAAYEPQRAVRTDRWKYIRRFDGRSRPVLPNCDDGPSKDEWLRHGWGERPVAEEYLFDLVFDPNEMDNRATDPAHAHMLDEMRGRLQRWMRATDDPLLHGPVPAPPGAVTNNPDGISPQEPTIPVGSL
jgi:arylsulfatase A-like enzyme